MHSTTYTTTAIAVFQGLKWLCMAIGISVLVGILKR